MHVRDRIFIGLFTFTLAMLVYFFGISITGDVPQSMYCDGSGCSDFCRSDDDCNGMTCCNVHDVGVCQSWCDRPYRAAMAKEMITVEKQVYYGGSMVKAAVVVPYTESPLPIENYSTYFGSMIILLLATGLVYLKMRLRHKAHR